MQTFVMYCIIQSLDRLFADLIEGLRYNTELFAISILNYFQC